MVVICFEVVGVWINAGFWRSCWDLAVLVWFQFSLGLLVFAEFSIVAGSCCWIRALRCLGMVVICFEVVCVCGDLDCSVVELDGLGCSSCLRLLCLVLFVRFWRVFQGLVDAVWMLLLMSRWNFVLGLVLIGSSGGHRRFCLLLGCGADG